MGKKVQYEVKWVGYSEAESTWEVRQNFGSHAHVSNFVVFCFVFSVVGVVVVCPNEAHECGPSFVSSLHTSSW